MFFIFSVLSEPERGSLPVIATVFDKLNHEYKKYLEAEQSYTMVVEAGQSRSNPLLKRPVRTQAVIDQSDMYTHVLSVFTEKKEAPHKFTIAVLMEYIRSLNQFQIAVQHYLYELVIKTLVQHNLFYTLHQFLQYHVLSDSKPLVCKASCFQKPVMEVRSLRNFSVVPLFALGLSIAVLGKHLPSCTSALSGHVKKALHGK